LLAVHSDPRRTRGQIGESIAARHLERRGYRVIARNYRTRYGEIDLIAVDDGAIVFCEVKTRAGVGRSGPAAPFDAIGMSKRRRVRMMAAQWLAAQAEERSRPRRAQLRFDAIGVTLGAGDRLVALDHLEGAF
jgi:putative endonuclease